MRNRSAFVASAAAALLLAGVAPAAHAAGDSGAKVKCEGVNSCKGHSDCKTAMSSCKGKNSCAGKGFKMMTQDECDAAKAKMEKKDSM